MAQSTYTTKLLEKVPRAGDIVSFRWERPAGYDFQAGQWLVITFPRQAPGSAAPSGPSDGDHTHHFSHSCSPLDPLLEFTTRLRGSEFKNALDALPIGTEIQVEGPYGSFILPPDAERVVFLTGGIGITCVRSILRWLAGSPNGLLKNEAGSVNSGAIGPTEDGLSCRSVPSGGRGVVFQQLADLHLEEVVLLFANRSEKDIPFRDELDELAQRIPQLRIVHVLSRPEEGWQGHRGHIDEELLAQELSGPETRRYYLSGPPSLGESMRRLLAGRGVDPGSIIMEQFLGYE